MMRTELTRLEPQGSTQLVVLPSDPAGSCDRARRGYYAVMSDLEKIENNLRRRLSRREWWAFRASSKVEFYA